MMFGTKTGKNNPTMGSSHSRRIVRTVIRYLILPSSPHTMYFPAKNITDFYKSVVRGRVKLYNTENSHRALHKNIFYIGPIE